ncbi:MAG: hypothetical protein QNJ54_33370 [Prochloraceae cyanobacterium]|nr:hypothetical protein [Prochloraceae cyanobacterium]
MPHIHIHFAAFYCYNSTNWRSPLEKTCPSTDYLAEVEQLITYCHYILWERHFGSAIVSFQNYLALRTSRKVQARSHPVWHWRDPSSNISRASL